MAQPSPAKIPFLYRFYFTWLVPLMCIWAAYMDFFDPTMVLSSHIPNPTPDIGHAMILRQRGGGMLNFGVISAFLLRYTSDINIWKIVAIADLLVDFTYFWSVWVVLGAQQRLDPGLWRAEDWGSIVITGTATVMRLAFVLGIGLRGEDEEKKKA